MNLQSLVRQIERYRRRELLIDTNLLLLYFVGAFRPDRIRSFNRTSRYSVDDFALLEKVISSFKRIITTPHVLTEVSNLMGQCGEPLRSDLRGCLQAAIEGWNETSTPSRTLAKAAHFLRFGRTDTAIADLAPGSCLVLTDDRPLAGLLESRNVAVIRFPDLQSTCL
ncbi:MAG: hypothetical protein ACLQU3_29570 [Limisphaerales bacterium]